MKWLGTLLLAAAAFAMLLTTAPASAGGDAAAGDGNPTQSPYFAVRSDDPAAGLESPKLPRRADRCQR